VVRNEQYLDFQASSGLVYPPEILHPPPDWSLVHSARYPRRRTLLQTLARWFSLGRGPDPAGTFAVEVYRLPWRP
jgi:hypothetical protein